MKILLICPNNKLSDSIISGLGAEGFQIDHEIESQKALLVLFSREYDLVLITTDSGIDYLSEIKTIKSKCPHLPIILLSKLNDIKTRLDGLIAGFDDVINAECSVIELSIRIKIIIARYSTIIQINNLKYGDIVMDLKTRSVQRAGKEIYLRKKEFEILEYMLHYPEQVLSRQRLLQHIWPEDTFLYTNTVDVHVASMRKKIETTSQPRLIHTVHGIGYKISLTE